MDMRIAICEDNQDHAEILQNMIQRWAEKKNKRIELCCFHSAEQFLFHMKDGVHYNLAFLDIQMGKMNGMQLAKRIREEEFRKMVWRWRTERFFRSAEGSGKS